MYRSSKSHPGSVLQQGFFTKVYLSTIQKQMKVVKPRPWLPCVHTVVLQCRSPYPISLTIPAMAELPLPSLLWVCTSCIIQESLVKLSQQAFWIPFKYLELPHPMPLIILRQCSIATCRIQTHAFDAEAPSVHMWCHDTHGPSGSIGIQVLVF